MLRFFKRVLRPQTSLTIDLFELLEKRPPRRFWHSNKRGSTVSVSVPDFDGEKLILLFQMPIEASDVKDGKLVPFVWSATKRRGGKRQTGLTISLENAEALHSALGEALKDAKAKQRRKEFTERVVNLVLAHVAEQNALVSAK